MTTSDTRDVEATVAEVRSRARRPPRRPRSVRRFVAASSLPRPIASLSSSLSPQVIKCADAGAEMVRITVQGMQEAKACAEIKKTLLEMGCTTPLIADVDFAPNAAMTVDRERFDKRGVNPGNFADGRKKFEDILYETDEEYDADPRDREDLHRRWF